MGRQRPARGWLRDEPVGGTKGHEGDGTLMNAEKRPSIFLRAADDLCWSHAPGADSDIMLEIPDSDDSLNLGKNGA